jgi:hypothetical protein
MRIVDRQTHGAGKGKFAGKFVSKKNFDEVF